MERLRKILIKMLCLCGIALFFTPHSAMAATINYKYVDGTTVVDSAENPVTTDNTVTTTDFTEAKTAIGAENIIAFVTEDYYDTGLYTPIDASIAAGGNVVVVTTDKVTAGGKIGTKGTSWFIYNKTLYIVSQKAGGSELSDESASPSYKGTYNRTINFPGDGFHIENPSMEKGSITVDGYGMVDPAVGDELALDADEYYDYVDNTSAYKFMKTGARDSISLTGLHYSTPSKAGSVLDAAELPWINYADDIETVYFGPDITVKGNIAQMFNGRTKDGSGTRYPAIILGNVGESLYTSLKNVYIYSDFSQVTSMAATFARCPELINVSAYKADRSPADTFDLSALDTTAFMFYGDENLSNSYEGSLVDIMDLSSGSLENTMFMFAGCESIQNPVVKDYNMANVVNMDSMFHGAKEANITFSAGADASVAGWDVSNVKTALCTFAGVIPKDEHGNPNYDEPNTGLSPKLDPIEANSVVTGIADLSLWDLSSLVSGYGMFCQNLGVTGVNFNSTAGSYPALVDAAAMFNGCDNLANVSLAGVEMPALKYAHAMFRRAGMASGGSANLSDWSAPVLESTDHMFEHSSYTTINFDGSSDLSTVKETIAMFADNARLTSLGNDSLSHLRLDSVLDSSYMFSGDTALARVTVTDWDLPNVETMSHMFSDCESLSALDTGAWTAGSGDSDGDSKYLENIECFAYNTGISTASMEDWDTDHLVNAYMAFAKNPSLTEVTLPSMANSFVKLEDANGMFYDCALLETVTGTDTSYYKAPVLKDARGMFAFDPKLTQVDMKNLVQDAAERISYMFRGDEALTSMDMSGWDTSGAVYMQGMFDGCKKLATISTGNNVTSDSLKDMGMMFRDCYKIGDSLNTLLANFTATTLLEDMYASFEDCYSLISLDLSPMDLSHTTDLRRLAYMEESADNVTNKLTTIIVPDTIMTAAGLIETDSSDGNGNSINAFWVDGDGAADGGAEEGDATDDLKTTFIVDGEIPAKLKTYNFGGTNGDNDNRSFIAYTGRTINGADVGAYTFTSPTDVGVLKMSATSTLYKNGNSVATAQNIAPIFAWEKDGDALAGMTDTYTSGPNAAGVYRSTAMPGELTGSNTEKTVTYTLSAFPVVEKKIVATYTGPDIIKGNNYSKDNVSVKYTDAGGVEHTLTSADWSVPSTTVNNLGANTYTATYNPGDGDLTATFTVTGVNAGEPFITAVYVGPDIKVGQTYDKSKVTVHYTDAGGTTTTLTTADFMVSGYTVTKEGDNEFTATYITPEAKTLTDTFTVKGDSNAAGITAEYTGDKVNVGSNYSLNDVVVKYDPGDGTKVTLTPDDYTVDSLKVTKKGDNEFTATYKPAPDVVHTAKFTVPGRRVIGSIVSVYTGPSVLVGSEYDKANVTTTAYYADDTAKAEGFTVTPSGYSTSKVTNVGSNNITATYKDPDQGDKAFTSVFKVTGYKNVASISATYTGDKVKVGHSYDKGKVKVTVYYDDGTSSTTDTFTVDSQTVTGEGANSYTATYRDAFGNTYTAGFSVPGYKDGDSSSSSSSSSSSTWPGSNGSDYAGVSSVYPGTGYAASLPIGYNYGVASGIVQTGTTWKATLYIIGGIILLALLAILLYIRFMRRDKGGEE